MNKAIEIIAYAGTASLGIAPYLPSNTGTFIACVVGFCGLLPQAIKGRLWNLVLLNCSGIVGYLLKVI